MFSLAKLSVALGIETALIHDAASGAINLDEAFFEYLESRTFKALFGSLNELPAADANLVGFIWDEENRPLPGTFREPFEVPGIPTARDKMALPGKRK